MNVVNMILIIVYGFGAKWNNDKKYFKFQVLPKFQIVKNDE